MTEKSLTFDEMKAMTGQKLGTSGWTVIDQSRIDQFADCTGDHQWLHTDPERARRESPFRVTIAHGYLTLSIIGALCQDLGFMPENIRAAFNYGLDKVRFMNPVKVGSRVRLHATLISVQDKAPGQYLMKFSNSVEIEGEETPALIAETLVMFYERRKKPAA